MSKRRAVITGLIRDTMKSEKIYSYDRYTSILRSKIKVVLIGLIVVGFFCFLTSCEVVEVCDVKRLEKIGRKGAFPRWSFHLASPKESPSVQLP